MSSQLVEMLVAVMWGMGFYAGYVGSEHEVDIVVEKLELLLSNNLWHLAARSCNGGEVT